MITFYQGNMPGFDGAFVAATAPQMREVPNCWAMGQAAGVAAALSISSGVRVRDVNIDDLQSELTKQGVPLHSNGAKIASPVDGDQGSPQFVSAWEQARATETAEPES